MFASRSSRVSEQTLHVERTLATYIYSRPTACRVKKHKTLMLQPEIRRIKYYLGTNTVIEASDEADVVVAGACDDAEADLLGMVFSVIKFITMGFVGSGNVTELDSIKVAVDIGGRSDESACVHRRPT